MANPIRPLKDFLPMVLPYARSCPQPVAEAMLRLAVIDWCEQTRCWRHIITREIDSQRSIMAAPEYATIFEIETAEFNGCPLEAVQHSHVEGRDLQGSSEGEGPPRYITQDSPNTVTLVPFPGEGSLRLTLFLKPRSGSEFGADPLEPLQDRFNVVPEHIFIQNAEAIADGALSRILAIPKSEFTDLDMALYYRRRFEGRADRFFARNMKGQHRARVRTRYIDF